MNRKSRKTKMTIDKLAEMTQGEFCAVREEIQSVRGELGLMKEGIIGEVKKENRKLMQSNDKIINKLDLVLKDQAAHDSLHHRITDDLLGHETRLRKVEAKLAK